MGTHDDSLCRGVASNNCDPREWLGRIRQSLADGTKTREETRDELDQFARSLRKRFAAEERAGRFEEVVFRAPWLTAEAQVLQRQHEILQHTLAGICRQLHTASDTPFWREEVALQLDHFIEQFLEHEAGEHALLQEAFAQAAWLDE